MSVTMIVSIVLLFTALLFFLVILWYILKAPYIKALKNVPGPPFLPIVGNLHQFTSDTSEMLPFLINLKEKYGNIFKIFIGFSEISVIVTDYNFLETILGSTKELNKSKVYTYLHKWMGFGLLTSSAHKWKKQRRMITPAFHFKILEQFLEVFQKNDKIFVAKLEKELHGKSFDIYTYVTLLSLDNIAETAMNTEINAQDNDCSAFVKSTRTMSSIIVRRQFHLIESNNLLYKLTNTYSLEKKSLKVLHDLTDRVIQERKLHLSQNPEEINSLNEGFGIRNRVAFLDLLLRSTIDGRPLTQHELRNEVDTFMFEGHDTTASAISFTIYSLSKYQDIQQKVLEEIISVIGKDLTRLPTFSELNELKYLEAVIKESLRLYPSVPVFARELQNDFEYNGIKYPKGTTITVFAFGIMRDAKNFPNPEKFDPDRFLVERNFHPYAFIPFSAGPRNCIGQKYAMLEIKSTIVDLLKHYEVLEATDFKLVLSHEAVLKGQDGINVRIQRRKL